MSRCRNCGELDHLTQDCEDYGPWFPAPDKVREDYAEQEERISHLVAADILHEHERDHESEGVVEVNE